MGKFTALRQRVGAFIGGFEGGLSARQLKSFHASRAHVNTLIQASGNDMTAMGALASQLPDGFGHL